MEINSCTDDDDDVGYGKHQVCTSVYHSCLGVSANG